MTLDASNEQMRRRARRATAFAFFVAGAVLATWAPHIPAVQARLSIGPAVLGLALLAMGGGGLTAMLITGWLIQRFGSARVTRVGAVGVCLLLPWPVFAVNLPLLIVGLFVWGAWNGMLDVAMNAQAVVVERRYGRPIMSSLHALFSIGGLVGAGFAGVVLESGASTTQHLALVIVPLLVGVMMGARWLLADSAATQSGAPLLALPRGPLIVLGVVAVLSMVSEGAVLDWSAVYLRNVVETGPGLAAGGFAAFSATMTVARLAGDRLIRRFGEVRLLRGSAAVAALGLAAGLLIAEPWAAVLGFACVGLGLANVVPTVFSAAGRVPGMSPGYGIAAVSTVGYFGFLAGPPAIGIVSQGLGLSGGLGLIVAFALLIAALASWVAVAERRGSQPDSVAHSGQ